MVENNIKVLIAEDEESIRNGLSTYISTKSSIINKVYTAENGREALDMIICYKPELAVMDIRMPFKDGLTVLREAQVAGVFPKSIILSGYDEFNYAQQALRLGVVDFLLKPCRPTDLLPLLESIALESIEIEGNSPKKEQTEKDNSRKNAMVESAKEYIDEHFMDDLSLKVVSEYVGITSAYLCSLFANTLDCGFVDYLNQVRVDRACSYLCDPRLKTYEVAYKVGFKDEKYFAKVFKKITGCTPSQFRKESLRML